MEMDVSSMSWEMDLRRIISLFSVFKEYISRHIVVIVGWDKQKTFFFSLKYGLTLYVFVKDSYAIPIRESSIFLSQKKIMVTTS